MAVHSIRSVVLGHTGGRANARAAIRGLPRRTLFAAGGTALCARLSAALAAGPVSSRPSLLPPPLSSELWRDDILPFRPVDASRVVAPPGSPTVLILPGFGNCSTDYTAPFGDASESLLAVLTARGFNVSVLQCTRFDWARVAQGLVRPAFWKSALTTDPGYEWYLDRVDAAVSRSLTERPGQVSLLAHSAGGWLARAWLARFFDPPGAAPGGRGADHVAALVTLGSPHYPSPPPDLTGGALTWVSRSFPGAYYASRGVRYTCVTSRTVRGRPAAPGSKERTLPNYSATSYEALCGGSGEGVVGDAVVPCEFAVLKGASNIVLQGAYHSMSKVGTFEEPSGLPWYGSEACVDAWADGLLPARP